MASFRISETSIQDDDLSAIIGEYSIPNLAEITTESLLTKSQYAKVIFHDLLSCYPTDADIWCRYSLTEGITSRCGDRVALYRVGWSSVHDHVQFELAPIANNKEEREFQVLFRAETLPKDNIEFYQLCYVNVDDSVCGASVPFQFRPPLEEELCEVEEKGGLMVVRSRTAINGDKLRDAAKLIGDLETEKLAHEEKIQILENTKDSLSMKLEELNSIQKREERLRQDIQLLDDEKNQAFTNLRQAEAHIQALNTTIESLNKDNGVLSGLLKSETQKMASSEVARFKIQVDNMQQMLDALAESKEMASQALRCEQSKVMTLNIEHDKYKYRAQHLEEENKGLQLELQQSRNMVEALQLQLNRNETLLELKTKDNEGAMGKLQQLIQQIGHMQYELQQMRDSDEALQLQLKQRDNQILMLQQESVEFQKKSDSFDQLNEEYTNLKRQLQEVHGELAKVEHLKQDNETKQIQMEQLQKEISALRTAREEKDKLNSELGLLSAEHTALQNEFYNSSMTSTTVQELKDQNASLQYRLAQLSKKETEINQNTASLEQLKYQLFLAEASNASLLHELQQIKELQPDWTVDRQSSGLAGAARVVEALGDNIQCITGKRVTVKQPDLSVEQQNNSLAHTTRQVEASGDSIRCTTTFRAPVSDVLFNHAYQTLKADKAELEVELQDVMTHENNFKLRCDSLSNRLMEIDEEIAITRSEWDMVTKQNQTDQADFLLINNRMATIQRQILRDDKIEGRLRDNTDEQRLERMSKRSHDLQCNIFKNNSQIHDLEQNIQVLTQERESLEDEIKAKPWVEKKTAEDKCKILEKLVTLDQQLITMRESLFLRTEENIMNKSCSDWPVQVGAIMDEKIRVENTRSYEINSTDLQECAKSSTEDAKGAEEELLNLAESSNDKSNINAHGLGVFTDAKYHSTGIKAVVAQSSIPVEVSIEPIEKAVADGIREGLKCGIITLKQQAAENLPTELSPNSINTSTESLTNVESKCEAIERLCQEKERILQDKLAGLLKDTVRKGLLEGMQDLDLGNRTVEENAAAVVQTSGEEAELKLRLELAAEEYRKLYTEKLKLEKRLARVQQKQVASVQPTSARQNKEADNSNGNTGYICPICGICFLTTESDLFTSHFEDHLS